MADKHRQPGQQTVSMLPGCVNRGNIPRVWVADVRAFYVAMVQIKLLDRRKRTYIDVQAEKRAAKVDRAAEVR